MQVAQLTEFQQQIAARIGARLIVCGDKQCINLGLYFPEPQVIGGLIEPNGVNCLYLDSANVYVQNFNQVAFAESMAQPLIVERYADNGALSHVELIDTDGATLWSSLALNSHEALMGFVAWLTTRDEPVVLYSKSSAGQVNELLKQYAAVQKLPAIGEDWVERLTTMPGMFEIAKEYKGPSSVHLLRFKGADGSVGYAHGQAYEMYVWTNPGGGLFVRYGDDEATQVFYESLGSFMNNWEWVPRD